MDDGLAASTSAVVQAFENFFLLTKEIDEDRRELVGLRILNHMLEFCEEWNRANGPTWLDVPYDGLETDRQSLANDMAKSFIEDLGGHAAELWPGRDRTKDGVLREAVAAIVHAFFRRADCGGVTLMSLIQDLISRWNDDADKEPISGKGKQRMKNEPTAGSAKSSRRQRRRSAATIVDPGCGDDTDQNDIRRNDDSSDSDDEPPRELTWPCAFGDSGCQATLNESNDRQHYATQHP